MRKIGFNEKPRLFIVSGDVCARRVFGRRRGHDARSAARNARQRYGELQNSGAANEFVEQLAPASIFLTGHDDACDCTQERERYGCKPRNARQHLQLEQDLPAERRIFLLQHDGHGYFRRRCARRPRIFHKTLGTLGGNIPLSFAEGEVVIGSGSSAEPAGAEDTTGRLSVILAPVIFGGQLQEGPNPQANTIPIGLSAFFDPSGVAIPQSAYQGPPDFANTPHLIDSDASGATFLSDATSGAQGRDIPVTSHSDQIELVNTAGEAAGKKITATISYQPQAADPDATFTIPAYFDLTGSVSAEHNISAGGSAALLTFTCTSTGCTKGN